MANKVNIIPNLRIDIPDFEGATQEFTDADNKERFQSVFQDRFAHVPEGFRIEIPDQGSFPGQVNVHNGLGFDRSGKLVTSENAADTQRSIVLTGTTTYYLEIEFTEESSFVDARAFWDPNFDNGTDPSGDVRSSGREFDQNVSTRKVPEWRIVTPVSTTDFEINTLPNSNKIPLAIIGVSAGLVVAGPAALANIPLRTSLKESYLAGASFVKVLNSRSMPQSFTCDIGAESIAVTANDQDNGILTFGGVTATAHVAGEQVSVAGGSPALYIQQRKAAKVPLVGTQDARPRLYSGDEEIGHALLQDADAGVGQSDVQIDNLKNYVDFLAGQIRQLKVGAAQETLIGQVAPPSTFSEDFRYFENAGGVLGARTNTVSVGDGATSWGDYNSVQSGLPGPPDAGAAIQGAIDAVPVGGIVYIKAGTYVLTSALSVTKPIRFVGDGHTVTIIDASAAPEAVTVNLTGAVGFRDIGITASGTAPYAVVVTQCGPKSVFAGCTIEGLTSVDCDQSRFVNCSFTTPGSGDDAINGIFTNCVFDQCQADCSVALAAARALNLDDASDVVTFRDCTFSLSDTTPTSLVEVSSVSTFRDCTFPVPEDGEAILVTGGGLTVRDSVFTQATSTSITTGTGIRLTDAVGTAIDITIADCHFRDCDVSIWLDDSQARRVSITGCDMFCPTVNRGRFGIYFTGAAVLLEFTIQGNTIRSYDDDSGAVTVVAAIHAENGSTTDLQNGSIANNEFVQIGVAPATNLDQAYGICIWDGCTSQSVNISENTFKSIRADGFAGALFLGDAGHNRTRIIGNNIRDIGNVLGDNPGSQYWAGFWISKWGNLVVANNVFTTLGHGGATFFNATAIRLGEGGIVADNFAATISGNVINNISHGSTLVGIYLDRNASAVSITGNHIGTFNSGGVSDGIVCQDSSAFSNVMKDITISSNIIRGGGLDNGILVDLVGTLGTADFENFTIIGNTIDDIDVRGILVTGDPTNRSSNFVISGNAIRAAANDIVGIEVNSVHFLSITGNTTIFNDGYKGVWLFDCIQFTVSGNTIVLNAFGSVVHVGIDAFASGFGSIVGNRVESVSGTGTGISVGSSTIASGNNVSKTGFATPISTIPGSAIQGLVNNTLGAPIARLITVGAVASDTNIFT